MTWRRVVTGELVLNWCNFRTEPIGIHLLSKSHAHASPSSDLIIIFQTRASYWNLSRMNVDSFVKQTGMRYLKWKEKKWCTQHLLGGDFNSSYPNLGFREQSFTTIDEKVKTRQSKHVVKSLENHRNNGKRETTLTDDILITSFICGEEKSEFDVGNVPFQLSISYLTAASTYADWMGAFLHAKRVKLIFTAT